MENKISKSKKKTRDLQTIEQSFFSLGTHFAI